MIDLRPFFAGINDYVVLRLPDKFVEGGDIDILCKDVVAISGHIVKRYGGAMIKKSNEHTHVDIMAKGKMVFRFDLIDRLEYSKFRVKSLFTGIVLDSKQSINWNGISINIPSKENDIAIRLFESLEHPEKTKHAEYVKRNRCVNMKELFEKYTNISVFYTDSNFYGLPKDCQVRDLSLIYELFFGRRKNGCFVEVGAYDGDYVSNTSALADIGWRGYCIEPIPKYYEQCRKRHAKNKNITVSQLAIGAEEKIVEINVGGASSTINNKMKELFAFKTVQEKHSPIEVKQLPLEDYLVEHKIKPGFELLAVDVEGYEWEVFRNFDIEKWRPQMVIVEIVAMQDKYSFLYKDCMDLRRYFKENNYREVYKDLTNTVFVLNSKPRLDYFLIWGHGLQYATEILDIIRSYKDIEILFVTKKSIADMDNFIKAIYSSDTVPYKHLIAKSKYLLDTPPEVMFILVKNKNTQERLFGRGDFRHIQCRLIKNIKTEIRNRFDPKGTEHHVVHASDYESQVRHVLKVLEFPPPEYFSRKSNPELDVPYHLNPFDNYVVKDISIDQLSAVITGKGLVPITETPHYKYITGDKQPYIDYLEKSYTTDDHSVGSFDSMIANFQYDCVRKRGRRNNLIVARTIKGEKGNYQIIDGIHRAAILKAMNMRILPVVLCLSKSLVCLIFSKNRAMQVQATIESFLLHCEESVDITVLYKATSLLHRKQYERLQRRFRDIDFQEEYDFQIQVQSIVSQFQEVLFLVDDNIFIKDFSLSDVTESLRENPDAVGFSLRLGRNTVYCYAKDKKQKLPEFEVLDNGILKYSWTQSVYDFSYPMEISSSVYQVCDIIGLLKERQYSNPNYFEGMLASSVNMCRGSRNKLLCYDQSVVFSNPANLVQNVSDNRCSGNYSVDELAKRFDAREKFDVEALSGFVPNSCHQEVEIEGNDIVIRKGG